MIDKKNLSKEDTELFRQAMAEVKPIKRTSRDSLKPKSSDTHTYRRQQAAKEPEKIVPKSSYPDLSPEGSLYFAQPGIQSKYSKKLRHGLIPFENKLDLHGLTLEAAEKKTLSFLDQALQQEQRCVLLIHGKGVKKDAYSHTLKEMVCGCLREHPKVLGFASAIPKHGGTGALYVLLKKQ